MTTYYEATMIENAVVITVSGGNVNAVFSSDPKTKVYLVDYDNLEADPNDDCSNALPAGGIEEFPSLAVKVTRTYPGLTKLAARLKG